MVGHSGAPTVESAVAEVICSEAEILAAAAGASLDRLLSVSTGGTYAAQARSRQVSYDFLSYSPSFDLNNRVVVVQVAVETRWALQLTGR